MKLLKRAEEWNKKLWYRLLAVLLKNKTVSLPVRGDSVRKILLFRYDAIGDMIITTPVFELIKERVPHAEIHVVASPYNYPLIEHDPRISKIYVHDGTKASFFKLIAAARAEKYQLVLCFVLFRTTYAGLMANLLAGTDAVKVTILHRQRQKLYSVLFNAQIELERDKSTMAEIQALMSCAIFGWNYKKEDVRLGIHMKDSFRENAKEFCKQHTLDRFAVLNISAGREYRRWSLEKNIEFLSNIRRLYPELPFVIVTAPADEHEAYAIARAFSSGVLVFPPTPSIMEVCGLVERAMLVVSPDTSIVHMASAFKKPTLAFYSYMTTYVMEWIPFGVPYRILISENKLPIESIPTAQAIEAFRELYSEVTLNIIEKSGKA